MRRRRALDLSATPAVAVALSVAALLVAASAYAGPSRRVVAVGDIHGAYDAFRSILAAADLVDEAGDWAGGDAILVQTGDVLDRGAEAIRVAKWLMKLQLQAPEQGGEVIVLLGNHEVMNLMGDIRFVTPEQVAPMSDQHSEKRRLEMCKQRVSILRKSAREMGEKAPPTAAARAACIEQHPLGLVEYEAALRPDAWLGRWLRALPAVVRVDDVVFLHGGISPEMAGRSLEEINLEVHREIDTFESWRSWLVAAGRMVEAGSLTEMARAVQVELAARDKKAEKGGEADPDAPDVARLFEMSDSLLLSQDGPLWFRGYDGWTEEEGLREMPEILAALDARHVVVGHTPQDPRRISCRFGGRVFLIDTGMLAEYYEGAPAALQFVGGRVEAIYLDRTTVLLDEAATESDRMAVGCH